MDDGWGINQNLNNWVMCWVMQHECMFCISNVVVIERRSWIQSALTDWLFIGNKSKTKFLRFRNMKEFSHFKYEKIHMQEAAKNLFLSKL